MKDYLLGRTKQFQAEIDKILANVEHNGLRGFHAEVVLRDFLADVLPKKYSVDTGLVYSIDGSGRQQRSKQVDIVIYDGFHSPPLQTLGGFKIFPAESVYATIAVTITLDTEKLLSGSGNCIENIQSVKDLPKSNYFSKGLAPGVRGGGRPSSTLGFVFAYKGDTSLDTLKLNLQERKKEDTISENKEPERFPDLICVLDKGYIITRPERLSLTINGNKIQDDFYVSEGQDALLAFTLLLITFLNQSELMPVNLFPYSNI